MKTVKNLFSPEEYLRVSQVKSLFSRFAKALREGTVKPPVDNTLQIEESDEESELTEETAEEIELNEQNDMNELVLQICNISAVKNDWVLVEFNVNIYVGKVKQVRDNQYKVSCMCKCSGENSFSWPKKADNGWYPYIHATIDGPIEDEERGVFKLSDEEYTIFNECQRHL